MTERLDSDLRFYWV